MGYDHEAFLANYVSRYNSNSPIETLEQTIQTWLDTHRPGKKVADIARNVMTKTQRLGLLPAPCPWICCLRQAVLRACGNRSIQVRFHLYDEWGTTFIDFTPTSPTGRPIGCP